MLPNLIPWYDSHKRDLPWRRSTDPYPVWISEIMLQQTQVATVIPYFERWIERFPSVERLALADEQEVLALWQGLGYYRRCKLLLQGARYVLAHGWPTNAQGWLKVPGVGRYTASAIASISLGEPVPVVDGNVERVFARLTGCSQPLPRLNAEAWRWGEKAVPSERPGDWNQALMELGATICKPNAPDCNSCPLSEDCEANLTGRTSELPAIGTKPAIEKQRHILWIPVFESKFGLRQISAGKWWAGMWEFPRVVCGEQVEDELSSWTGRGRLEPLGSFSHTVTNHRIMLEVFLHHCLEASSRLSWLDRESMESVPMPAPQRKAFGLADLYRLSQNS